MRDGLELFGWALMMFVCVVVGNAATNIAAVLDWQKHAGVDWFASDLFTAVSGLWEGGGVGGGGGGGSGAMHLLT